MLMVFPTEHPLCEFSTQSWCRCLGNTKTLLLLLLLLLEESGLWRLRASLHHRDQLWPCFHGDKGHWVLEFLLGSTDPDLWIHLSPATMTKPGADNSGSVQTIMMWSFNEHYLSKQHWDRLHLSHSDKLSPVELLQHVQHKKSVFKLRQISDRLESVCTEHVGAGVRSRCLPPPPVLSPLQVFAFDHCFWSMDESNLPKYAGKS